MAKRKTHNEYVSQVADVNPNIEVISKYVKDKAMIHFRCKKCGFEDSSRADNILKPILCKNCEGYRNIRYGVNDFYTLFPHFAAYMEDQRLAHKIGAYSHKKAWFICPNCSTRIFNSIVNVTKNGLSCPSCSSGRSYPNRLMFNILKDIKIPFYNEFHDTWTKNYLYDFMFELNDEKYIIEMDGGFHFVDVPSLGISVHYASLTDSRKDILAKCNGFEVIRIDCNYTSINERYMYIKNNIINSKLSSIIDLSNIDFDECDRLSQKSDFIRICEIYDNETHDIYKISDITGISYKRIIEHLKHGEEIGYTTYNHKKALVERNELRKEKLAKTNSCLLYCIETNEIFDSISSAKCYYGGGIDGYLNGKNTYAGMLSDGTKLTWYTPSIDEIYSYIDNGGIIIDKVI